MAGSEANNYNSYGNWVRAIDFPVDVVNSMNLSTNVNKTATDNIGKSHSMSFFGRLNFNYDHRYYLTAVVRRDVRTALAATTVGAHSPRSTVCGAWARRALSAITSNGSTM